MPEIKIGLAPQKVSFYDPKTNTYLTLGNPIKVLSFGDQTDLSGICRGLFSQKPAIVLYEGEIPQEAIEAWQSKFQTKIMKRANHFVNKQDKAVKQEATVEQKTTIEPEVTEEKVNPKEDEELKASSVETEQPSMNEKVEEDSLEEQEKVTKKKRKSSKTKEEK